MGCAHDKTENGHRWCTPCAAAAAGPRPALEWQAGDYALDFGGDPGKVFRVAIALYGISTDTPTWVEEIWVSFGDGSSHGAATNYMRLIVAPPGWTR